MLSGVIKVCISYILCLPVSHHISRLKLWWYDSIVHSFHGNYMWINGNPSLLGNRWHRQATLRRLNMWNCHVFQRQSSPTTCHGSCLELGHLRSFILAEEVDNGSDRVRSNMVKHGQTTSWLTIDHNTAFLQDPAGLDCLDDNHFLKRPQMRHEKHKHD